MGIVKYIDDGFGKKFNCGQALHDGWGIEWGEDLVGVKLQDRRNSNHKEQILKNRLVYGYI